jgi:hypothetical protein
MSELVQQAERVMQGINPAYAQKFGVVFGFLEANPDAAQNGRSRAFGSEEYMEHFGRGFAADRGLRPPVCPQTVPDPMVALVVEQFFNIDSAQISSASRHHNLAMGAENIIGYLLERYIAQVLEPLGWAWCSGSLVRDVDFVHKTPDGIWTALQVKNRDNTENNAGKRVREGTNILHWFRTFSRRPGDNWANFPLGHSEQLSEAAFREFVISYLAECPRE